MKWYKTFKIPKHGKSLGWAVYPFMGLKDLNDHSTRIHEEIHLKDQLSMLWLPWFILYGILWFKHGTNKSHPLEQDAYFIEQTGAKWYPYSWLFR